MLAHAPHREESYIPSLAPLPALCILNGNVNFVAVDQHVDDVLVSPLSGVENNRPALTVFEVNTDVALDQ